jgi:hypothetical protein
VKIDVDVWSLNDMVLKKKRIKVIEFEGFVTQIKWNTQMIIFYQLLPMGLEKVEKSLHFLFFL